jgi:cysteine sulfinate desulfinase/cysteine desulfurase-like protein
MRPILHGGFQEMGFRAGTENVAAIVGLGEASSLAKAEMAEKVPHQEAGSKTDGRHWSNHSPAFHGSSQGAAAGHVSFWIQSLSKENHFFCG